MEDNLEYYLGIHLGHRKSHVPTQECCKCAVKHVYVSALSAQVLTNLGRFRETKSQTTELGKFEIIKRGAGGWRGWREGGPEMFVDGGKAGRAYYRQTGTGRWVGLARAT